jgi:hypothetical protein
VFAWFDEIDSHSKKGQKILDTPLRCFLDLRKLISGMGNYSSCQFCRKVEEELGLTFATAIEALYRDRNLLKAFLSSLHQFCFQRNKWLRDKIEMYGLPSGIRHNEFWEELYLRRHVSDYYASGSLPYEIHTSHHRFVSPKIWSRSVNLPEDRVVRAPKSTSFTTNSLTVGPAAFMTGEDKVC